MLLAALLAAVPAQAQIAAWGQAGFANTDNLTGVIEIANGDEHTVVLKSNGTVACWGNNGSGQCMVPIGLGGVIHVAAGGTHTLALKKDGTVVCWGVNGACDNPPDDLSSVKQLAAGLFHSMALRIDGSVVCWGSNNDGQCQVPSGLGVVNQIAAGGDRCLEV